MSANIQGMALAHPPKDPIALWRTREDAHYDQLDTLRDNVWDFVLPHLPPGIAHCAPPNGCSAHLYPQLYDSHMTPHHDNIISGENPFNSDNSHIYGGPVISVSFGAEMFYHTIYPNHVAGQDYSMCQTEAKDNLKDGFKTSIPLEDMSIYISIRPMMMNCIITA